MRLARRVGLMQVMETVHGIGRAIGKSGITFKSPTVLLEPGNRVGHGDGALELFEHAIDQGPMRPGAAVRDIKVVAAAFRLEAR